jgi:predicted transcriptional regulator
MSDTLSLKIGKETPILGGLALIGQSTFFYAAPNTGKTLLTIALVCEDIKAGRIDPNYLYYIDVDDTARGLVEKLSVAEEFGFHMLSEGHNNFKTSEFLGILSDMIEQDQAHGVVIVLDTTKKFADLMDKKKTSLFMSVIRPFVAKGGTVIGMAHTNKHPSSSGKVMYGGTTDLRDDCDCCHTIEVIGTNNHENTVAFNNIKSRGNVLKQAAYHYSTAPAISYNEILLSVEVINDADLATVSQQAKVRNDAEIINCILSMIANGTNTKMALASAVAIDANISKNRALKIIECYTGDDLNLHKWQFSVQEHGKKVYAPLIKVTKTI